MVQIIENRAEVEGIIKTVLKHPKLVGYHQLKVQLEKSNTVNQFPNLAKNDEGKEIIVNVKPEQFNEMNFKEGQVFKGLVRKVSPIEYFM